MLHEFAEVVVGAVVEEDLGEVEVADGVDFLKEEAKQVVVADVHLSDAMKRGRDIPPFFCFDLA